MEKVLSEQLIEMQGQINGLYSYYMWMLAHEQELGFPDTMNREIFSRIMHLRQRLFTVSKLLTAAGQPVPDYLRDDAVAHVLMKQGLLSKEAVSLTPTSPDKFSAN